MVDGGLFEVPNRVVDDTEVDVSQELSSHVSDFLVLHVVLDGIVEVDGIDLTKFHVVNADAVIGQSFTMDIADRTADL